MRRPNECPEMGTLKAMDGVVFVSCDCGFTEALPDGASLDHVVLAEIHHVEFEVEPAATEPGA